VTSALNSCGVFNKPGTVVLSNRMGAELIESMSDELI